VHIVYAVVVMREKKHIGRLTVKNQAHGFIHFELCLAEGIS